MTEQIIAATVRVRIKDVATFNDGREASGPEESGECFVEFPSRGKSLGSEIYHCWQRQPRGTWVVPRTASVTSPAANSFSRTATIVTTHYAGGSAGRGAQGCSSRGHKLNSRVLPNRSAPAGGGARRRRNGSSATGRLPTRRPSCNRPSEFVLLNPAVVVAASTCRGADLP